MAAAVHESRHDERPIPTPLTQVVRALYEDSVVPVDEIARLAGVHPRTLYKYAQKGGWRRRYATQDIAAAVSKRAAKRQAAPPRPCLTSKGAGGRFIRSADAAKPFRRGLKALDRDGEARALPLLGRAAALSDDTMARTRRLRDAMTEARIMATLAGVLRDLAALEAAAKPAAAEEPEEDSEAFRAELARRIDALAERETTRQDAARAFEKKREEMARRFKYREGG